MKYLNTYKENKNDFVIIITDIPNIIIPQILQIINDEFNIDFIIDKHNYQDNDLWVLISLTGKKIPLDNDVKFDYCWGNMPNIDTFASMYEQYYITCEKWLKEELNIDMNYLIEGDKLGLL